MPACKRRLGRARGVFAVEFALVLLVLLAFVFGVVELARLLYLYNAIEAVTQRAATAAAVTDFLDPVALAHVRYRAVGRDSPGELVFGAPITDRHVRIDYLAVIREGGDSPTQRVEPIAAGDLPACAAANRHRCLADPDGATCIRLVRARICQPGEGTHCTPVPYPGLLGWLALPTSLPIAQALAPAQSLGAAPGDTPCQ